MGGWAAGNFQHSTCAMAVSLGLKANSLIPPFSFTFNWKRMLSEFWLLLTLIVHCKDELCMSLGVCPLKSCFRTWQTREGFLIQKYAAVILISRNVSRDKVFYQMACTGIHLACSGHATALLDAGTLSF